MKRRMLALCLSLVFVVLTLMGCSSKGSNEDSKDTTKNNDSAATTAPQASADNQTGNESSGEKIELRVIWWGNQTRNEVTQAAIDLYQTLNPNITITPEFVDWSSYWDKLSTLAAGGNLPDVIQMDYGYLNQYIQGNQLADLTPFVDSGALDLSDVADSIVASGKVNEKLYALSLGMNAPLMVYDKAIVEQAGVTIPEQPTIGELYDIGKKIYEKTGVKTYFDGGINMQTIIARDYGKYLYDEVNAGTEDVVKKHFDNVKLFGDAEFSISPDLLSEKNPDVVETKPIMDQTTWNDFAYSNQFIAISTQANHELGISMYPTSDDASAQSMYLKPSMFFSVAETSQYKEEAAKFISWFTNDVDCNLILMGERGIPISTKVADAVKQKVDAVTTNVFDYIALVGKVATPIDPPTPAGYGEMSTLLNTVVENLRYGGDVSEATKEFIERSQKILSDAKQ